jgi:flagellar hook assembly protein FlgD
MLRRWGCIVFLLVIGGQVVWAQDSVATADTARAWHDTAWTPIVVRNGVQIAYIFYSEADNANNGVVIRLRNQNEHPVRYAFTIIFRGPEGEASAQADGRLRAGEMKTGDDDGLFWIPFKDGRSIGEVGLREIEVRRVPPDEGAAQTQG